MVDQVVYQEILQKSSEGYALHKIICDEKGKPSDFLFIELNQAFEDFTGLRVPDVINKKASEVIPDLFSSKFNWLEVYGDIAVNGGEKRFKAYSEPLKRWYHVYAFSPIKHYFVTYFYNVTEWKDAVAQSKEHQPEIQNFFDVSLDLFCIANFNGFFEKINTTWFELLNYSKDDLLSQEYIHYVHPDDVESTLKVIDLLNHGERIVNFINRYRHKNGSYLFLEWRAVKNGEKIYASARDVTVQKELSNELHKANQMLTAVLDNIPIRIFWKDYSGNYLGCNAKFAEDAGLESPVAIIGQNDHQMSWHVYADHYRKDDLYVMNNNKPKLNIIENLIDSKGNKRWARTNKVPLVDFLGEVYGVMGTFEDITESMMSQKIIEESNLRYDELSKKSRAVIFEVDSAGRFTYVSPIAYDIYGYAPEELVGNKFFYDLAPLDEKESFKTFGMNVLSGRNEVKDFEHKIQHKNGDVVWVSTNGYCVVNADGQLIKFTGMDIDITYLKKIEDKIRYVSYHDQLTGLYNRSFFEEELKRLDTQRNYPLGLFSLDVNGLKLINDAFGHKAGDELLVKVANVLKKECRQDDIIARLGGDEFIVLLPNMDDLNLKLFGKRMMLAFKEEDVRMLPVSISYGYASKTLASEIIQDVMNRADTTMYKHKKVNHNKNRNLMIQAIMRILYRENHAESQHAHNVSVYCEAIAKALKFDSEKIERIRLSGLLHDIGKIGIFNEILNKKTALSEEEWYEVKRHPEISYTILSASNDYNEFSEDVLYHHERYDGKGYPKGLKGENIPQVSRIICIADAYDAMTTERPFRTKKSKEAAIEELKKGAGYQFDPVLVNLFIEEFLNSTL